MADQPVHPMNGWEKRDLVELTLKNGDDVTANNVLRTVQDQKLFMELLASKAEGDSLPGLHIDRDQEGHVHQVKTDKLTVSDGGGTLTAQSNGHSLKRFAGEQWAKATALGHTLAAPFAELGDALKKSGTPESLVNKNIDARVKFAEEH